MGNTADPPGVIIQEWIKLRFGFRSFADHMGKNHGTLYNWLKDGTVKKKNLIAIIETAMEMGTTPAEIKDLLNDIGEKPESFNLNKVESTSIKGKKNRVGNQTIITGISPEEIQKLRIELSEKDKKIASLEGQLKAYKDIVEKLTSKE